MSDKTCLDHPDKVLSFVGYFTLSRDGPMGFISMGAWVCPECGCLRFYTREVKP